MGAGGAADIDVFKAVPVHTIDAVDPYEQPAPPPLERPGNDGRFVRSASFTALVGLTRSNPQEGIKRTFSDNVLSSPAQQPTKLSNSMQSANVELFRRASRKTKKRMSIAGLGRENEGKRAANTTDIELGEEEQSKSLTQTVGGSLKNFARRSWMPSARTESPSRKAEPIPAKKRNQSPKKRTSYSSTPIAVPEPVASRASSRSSPPIEDDDSVKRLRASQPSPAPPKTRSLREMHVRNQSATSINRLSRQSSRTSLGSRTSADGMYLEIPTSKIPPLPQSTSSDKLSAVSIELSRKKDPLWSEFRAIEGEWSNFQSKTGLQKAKVIRTTLLPFLSNHAIHPSNQSLRAEDLDRRVVILNKWWTGLLELLNGRSNQSISGTDRPAFLEAVMEIMVRPEWRAPPLHARPSAPSKATGSVESDESDFLLDSIHQNVRNIFVQNLLSQMAFVVDRLSMRSAPASLVNFSGRTCAFAFFFCPGVADVLVRLWHIPAATLRRIFSEYGVLHNNAIGALSAEISQSFPPPVRSLSFTSQSSLTRHIQPKAQRPAGSESIRWYGPWVNRWIGRDSDLLFVFVKHYHFLVGEFYPSTLSKQDCVCIPGLAPVHAQLLVVVESTLYRHVGHFPQDAYAVGDNADVMVPMPMSIPNATRSIGENRLVVLMRDIVAEVDVVQANICTFLVESFERIMKAATRRLSMYNSEASFVLCDLIEEVFPTLTQYEHFHGLTGILDWEFWIEVLQQMVQSETCMTQIRVIALVYGMWPIITSSEDRRSDVVLNWILRPATFDQLFNHWSPMVRHYFHRLLCWRVGRSDGEATESELEMYQTLAARLNTAWAHHQYLVAEAEMRTMCPPSSTACSPAPGRTLIIIRTDSQPASPSPFTTFDKLLSRDQTSPYAAHSDGIQSGTEADLPSSNNSNNNKRRWSLFRGINLFTSSPSNGRPGEVTPPESPQKIVEKRGTHSGANSAAPSRPGTPPHQTLSFKFSLEHVNTRPQMPVKNLKKLPMPVLPTNAQKLLNKLSALVRLSSESVAPVEIPPLKPKAHEVNAARYSGRALAEWAQVVSECRNFYTRRKQEGCPKDSLVETPAMAVETFRMFS